ncbi:zinc finger protein [Trichonephila clavata]|uniref:Zinc finger protein n=1 Tax=Trichonephila clavata TaxID=2740835 RepID=A0A8X6HIM1_TRICU|nr:zinc finger protein [Trichonephila clavata]
MATYNSNFGYPPGPSHQQSTSLPFTSTPSNIRPQRPRFAFSGYSSYPRPRSSASKPNPDCFSENLRNNYEGYDEKCNVKFPMTSNLSNSYPRECSGPESFSNSPIRNSYGNSSESLLSTPSRSSFGNSNNYNDNLRVMPSDSMVNNYGNSKDRMEFSYSSGNNSLYPNNSNSLHSLNETTYYSCNESFYESPKKSPYLGNVPSTNFSSSSSLPYSIAKPPLISINPDRMSINPDRISINPDRISINPDRISINPDRISINPDRISINPDRRPDFQEHFKNKKDQFKADSSRKQKPFYEKKFNQEKKPMATKNVNHCSVCSIDFTSSIPYEMHLRGAKHAKKLKLQDAYHLIQKQVAQNTEIAPDLKSFRCDLCNITANSSLQLQTHLDGTKHKNKSLQLQQSKEKKEESDSTEVNGKSNGSAVIRPLPAEFGEPQPTKICKFSCETCNLTVNSDIQLQQHLASKKHQAKVEGKPIQRKKFKSKKSEDDKAEDEIKTNAEADDATQAAAITGDTLDTNVKETNSTEPRKMIKGVKTLSASFVQGDTLQ